MNTFFFWQRWLLYTSIFFALSGVIYAFFGQATFFNSYHNLLAEKLYGQNALPAQVESFRQFAAGPIGATVAAAYILLAYIVHQPFKNKERWSWNAIAISFTVWFIVDSIICIYKGIYIQAFLMNGFSYLIKIIPLVLTRKYFT
jgi:hypothetical protein